MRRSLEHGSLWADQQLCLSSLHLAPKGLAAASPHRVMHRMTRWPGVLLARLRRGRRGEAREPRLIAFNAYVNEDGNEVAIVQVHPDVDSMEFHMKVIREHVEHAAWEFLGDTVSEHISGAVSDSALETMRLQGSSRPEVMSHGIGGFTRSAAEPAAFRQ